MANNTGTSNLHTSSCWLLAFSSVVENFDGTEWNTPECTVEAADDATLTGLSTCLCDDNAWQGKVDVRQAAETLGFNA